MSHWCVKYLGKEWRQDYDCYDFFKDVQKNIFNREKQLDFIAPGYENRLKALEFVETSRDVKNYWRSVIVPCEGDAVLFGNVHNSFHIGVWILLCSESGVLHNQEGHGVVFTPRSNIIQSSISIHSYLRCVS